MSLLFADWRGKATARRQRRGRLQLGELGAEAASVAGSSPWRSWSRCRRCSGRRAGRRCRGTVFGWDFDGQRYDFSLANGFNLAWFWIEPRSYPPASRAAPVARARRVSPGRCSTSTSVNAPASSCRTSITFDVRVGQHQVIFYCGKHRGPRRRVALVLASRWRGRSVAAARSRPTYWRDAGQGGSTCARGLGRGRAQTREGGRGFSEIVRRETPPRALIDTRRRIKTGFP